MKLDEQALAHIEADCTMGKTFDADTVRLLVQQIFDAREEEYERGYEAGLAEAPAVETDQAYNEGWDDGYKHGWGEARVRILAPSFGDPEAFTTK
jgi:flagellar biosynthesis/type III secretory pathway protein FliH